jgi:putative hemolysin
MLELVRSRASVFSLPTTAAQQGDLIVGLAQSNEEIEAIQRLRYAVFLAEYEAKVSEDGSEIDRDMFDPWCEHLMVQDLGTKEVVGTYRVLTPHQARRAGGYYSESEFDLCGLGDIKQSLVEFGRACIHPAYRNGSALMMLWSGLAEILKQGRYQHVFGCASVSLRDDGVTAAAVWRHVKDSIGANGAPVVTPLHRYPVEHLDSDLPAQIPALIKGYLRLGAGVCGQPTWDPDFNTADFPMLLSIDKMGARYRRHFGFDGS